MYKIIFTIMISLFMLSGCGMMTSSVQQAAQEQTVLFTGNVIPNENAERLIEKAFRNSTVAWDKDRSSRIDTARNAIMGMGTYIQDRLNFDSSIPYYSYKVWFEFTSYQYMKLQEELDSRVKKDGAISEEGLALYEYARRDINTLLNVERLKISSTEKSIEDKATAATLEDMKTIYATIKPLVEMVL